MSMIPLLSMILGLAGVQPQAEPACPSQPLPPAADALAPLPHQTSIVFAAEPSLELPGRAWVVRLSRRGDAGPAAIEIVRLRRQHDCNRYDVEGRWQAAASADEFDALARRLAPHVIPSGASSPLDRSSMPAEVATDGTELTVKLERFRWAVTRQLHSAGPSGSAVSAIFHAMIEQHVPASLLPATNWRAR